MNYADIPDNSDLDLASIFENLRGSLFDKVNARVVLETLVQSTDPEVQALVNKIRERFSDQVISSINWGELIAKLKSVSTNKEVAAIVEFEEILIIRAALQVDSSLQVQLANLPISSFIQTFNLKGFSAKTLRDLGVSFGSNHSLAVFSKFTESELKAFPHIGDKGIRFLKELFPVLGLSISSETTERTLMHTAFYNQSHLFRTLIQNDIKSLRELASKNVKELIDILEAMNIYSSQEITNRYLLILYEIVKEMFPVSELVSSFGKYQEANQ